MQPEQHRKPSLKNRGEIAVACADCGTALMSFLVVRNNDDLRALPQPVEPITTRVRCDCGICGGKSYVHTIEGQFYPGAAQDNIAFEPLDRDEQNGEGHAVTTFKAWRIDAPVV